jgi:hypothetical protein
MTADFITTLTTLYTAYKTWLAQNPRLGYGDQVAGAYGGLTPTFTGFMLWLQTEYVPPVEEPA